MKFAFMSFSCPELGLGDLLSLAERLGYSAIEPRAQDSHAHGVELDSTPEQREEIREVVAGSPTELCCIATSCSYSDPAQTAAHVEDTHRAIDLAGDLDCPRIRVFGGGIPGGISREESVDRVSQALASVADHAAERDVRVCVETHDSWCDPADVAAVMEKVDHPNLCVNWDIMHPIVTAGWTMADAFETLRPWIQHVHVHDGLIDETGLKLLPLGEGVVDHGTALRCLRESGYGGFISGEWIHWEAYETHLPRELAALKSLLDQG